MTEKLFYLELDGKPQENELIALFRVDPAREISIEQAANAIAAESSIGTWTEISTMSEDFRERYRAKVIKIEGDLVEIAYPLALFERGNMPQIYSSVAGNIFGMKDLKKIKLLSVKFPDELAASFKGPNFGIQGIRKSLNIKDRPIVGTIVKPKIGLSPDAQAEVLFEAMRNGCDIVKDDENLTSQDFCPFEKRVKKCLEKAKKAEDETGEGKGYVPNITAEVKTMLKRAGLVEKLGGSFAMIDIITAGFSSLQTLRDAGFRLVFHGHRAMHAAITRFKQHGISMQVFSKTARLIGIDQLHIGTAVGKMEGGKKDVLDCVDILRNPEEGEGDLKQSWGKIKPAMPIASGGLHPGHIPALVALFGKEAIFQFGGGIHGHPKGTGAGARAVRQALKASLDDIPLKKALSENGELKDAIDKWGF